MRVVFEYSHLGGAEILQSRFPAIDAAINEAISAVGEDFRTFQSRESGRRTRDLLYAPRGINKAFKEEFNSRGFNELKRYFDIDVPGWTRLRLRGHKQVDFALDRVLVEVQLGKYFAMFYDMAKLEYFYRQNLADVGVEIVPSHLLQAQMSTGVGRGEMLIVDIIALQRSFPTFPVKVILIQPESMPVPTEVVLDANQETTS
jgi:hypothetical protein